MDWGTFGSTILGGSLTILGGIIQQNYSEKKNKELTIEMEKERELKEVREEKIDLIKDIMGNKHVLVDGVTINQNAKAKFDGALNLISVVFQDNEKIIMQHEKFYRILGSSKYDPNDEFYKLIALLYEDVNLKKPTYDQFIKTFTS